MNDLAAAQKTMYSDEIDLTEIYRSLWKQKYLIFGFVVLFGLVAFTYAYFAPRQYQASSVLRPAPINELDAINHSGVYKLPPGEALLKVGTALDSYETRLNFFRENEALFGAFTSPGRTLEQSFEAFNLNSISLVIPDSKKADDLNAFVRMDLLFPKGVDGVGVVNGFIKYAIATEREKIAADLKVIVDNRLRELNVKLSSARSHYDTEKSAKIASLLEADSLKRAQLQDELKALRLQLKTERNDRVAQLSEAISIASSLGIKKPTTPSALADSQRTGSGSVMRTEVNSQTIPLYFMGTEALEAERAILQQRKSDDFTEKRIAQIAKELQLLQVNREAEVLNQRANEDIFLRDVEPIRSEIARLHNLNIDVSNLKLVTIDQMALQPTGPVKPNKKMILLLGLALGLIAGLCVALGRYFLTAQLAGVRVAIR
ncbi:Wzz/FepE/Etk N-terminal domain-containing protein [Pseudomonas moorei]|uniref:Wzz/FepE/Etk N-terminal domain-containing protein n=1 Tax=Pseudomonas moorei TaxID=395599 RepID=UPI00200E6819|nr:Wzz/FepE/Etk N-terminal domain-containing protein [Pseudomonas moorei]